MSSLAIDFAGLHLKNPLNTASGTFAFARQFESFFDVGNTLGAVTCKGCAAQAWPGNDGTRLAKLPSAIMNSVGLQNPGIAYLAQEYASYFRGLEDKDCRVIVQAVGHSIEEYVRAVELYEEKLPFVSAIELNVSCPNVERGGAALGASCDGIKDLLLATRPRTKKPLIVKMGPFSVGEIARSCEMYGADALSLINTIPGMAIDVTTRRSRVSRPTAGVSGPAIHAQALMCVWEAHKATKLPLCGIGGVASGVDVAEMILVGASVVSLGSVNLYNPGAAVRILDEFTTWFEEQHVESLAELVGVFEE